MRLGAPDVRRHDERMRCAHTILLTLFLTSVAAVSARAEDFVTLIDLSEDDDDPARDAIFRSIANCGRRPADDLENPLDLRSTLTPATRPARETCEVLMVPIEFAGTGLSDLDLAAAARGDRRAIARVAAAAAPDRTHGFIVYERRGANVIVTVVSTRGTRLSRTATPARNVSPDVSDRIARAALSALRRQRR